MLKMLHDFQLGERLGSIETIERLINDIDLLIVFHRSKLIYPVFISYLLSLEYEIYRVMKRKRKNQVARRDINSLN